MSPKDEGKTLPYESVWTFDTPLRGYNTEAGSSSSSAAGGMQQQQAAANNNASVMKTSSLKSEESMQLTGPMEVDGSVLSKRDITFQGDFAVRKRIEAYRNIEIDGNLTCQYVFFSPFLSFPFFSSFPLSPF